MAGVGAADAGAALAAAAAAAVAAGGAGPDARIQALKQQRAQLKQQQMQVQRDVKNESRKRQRLMAAASKLSNNDLAQVFGIRAVAEAKAKAKAKAKAAAAAPAGAGALVAPVAGPAGGEVDGDGSGRRPTVASPRRWLRGQNNCQLLTPIMHVCRLTLSIFLDDLKGGVL